MKNLSCQIFPLFLSEFGKKKGVSKIILPSVEENESLSLGQFFVLLEVNSKTEVNNRIINLFEDIAGNYYQTFAPDDAISLEDHLEIILQKANHKLQRLVESAGLATKPEFLDFILGVIKGNELYLVQRGYFVPFLIRAPRPEETANSQNKTSEAKIKMVNILESLEAEARPEAGGKSFSHIISGKITPGDYLFFCNENILDNISLSKIKKTITTLPPRSAVEHLKNLLLEVNNPKISFLGLLAKFPVQAIEEKKFTASLKKSPSESLSKLVSLKEKTSKLLSPAIVPNFAKIKSQAQSAIHKVKQLGQKKSPTAVLPKPESAKLETTKPEPASEVIKPKLQWPAPLTKFYKLASNKNGQLEQTREKIKEEGVNRLTRIKHWLKALSPSSRTILIITLVFVALFVISLGVIYSRKQKEERRVFTDNLIASIKEKQDLAEAKIIIGESEQAKEAINQAEELLKQIPADQKGFEEEVASLSAEIAKQRNKIYHIVEVSDPHLVYNFVNLGAEVRVDDITILRKKLYAFKQGQNLVWEYNLEDKKTRELQLKDLTEGKINYALKKNDDAIYFYLDNNKLSEYSTVAEKIKIVTFSAPEKINFKSLTEYSDNLYLLDTANNQIWRYVAAQDGFGSPKGWFAESVSLTNADSLAVDGEIYLLENNGQIKKFFKGQAKEFAQEKVEPEISSASKLYTNQGSDYLYYLTPQKLIVLGKDGKIKAQYSSPKFTDLKDFVINEADKTIYVLTENSVYSFAAEHL